MLLILVYFLEKFLCGLGSRDQGTEIRKQELGTRNQRKHPIILVYEKTLNDRMRLFFRRGRLVVTREYWSEFNLKTKQSSVINKMNAKQFLK